MFPHDTRADKRGELGGDTTRRVFPRKLKDRGAFTGDGVLPDLADLDRCAIRRAVRVRPAPLQAPMRVRRISSFNARNDVNIGAN
jgi:hypothetical protein